MMINIHELRTIYYDDDDDKNHDEGSPDVIGVNDFHDDFHDNVDYNDDDSDDNHHESALAVIDVEAKVCAHARFRVNHLESCF